jgi:tetratricopeptide (TPR) repeat protein
VTGRIAVVVLAVVGCSCVRRTQVSVAPSAPSVWDRQIHNAKDAGDGDYALRALREKVAAEPDSPGARVALAAAYRERGYPDVALEMCRLAAQRFPDSGDVQLALVRALRDLNRRADAIAGLEAWVAAHPQKTPEYASWLGVLRDESGQWTAGETAHRQALELDNTADYLHNNLGYNLLMQGKNQEAAAEFREALKRNPASQVARNNLGMALARQESSKEAVSNWQSVSDPAAAHNNLAAVWIEKRNYPAARAELEIALGYNRNLAAALKNLELVSRLDGNPATIPVKRGESGWARFKRLFVGPLDPPRREVAGSGADRASVTK